MLLSPVVAEQLHVFVQILHTGSGSGICEEKFRWFFIQLNSAVTLSPVERWPNGNVVELYVKYHGGQR